MVTYSTGLVLSFLAFVPSSETWPNENPLWVEHIVRFDRYGLFSVLIF